MTLSGDVLLVDDNPVNLRLLAEVLKPAGLGVRAATSGARAFDAVRAQRPDLVLLDIELPDLNGFEVCRRLLGEEATRDLRILFVSAHDTPMGRSEAFRAGGVDYLTKPYEPSEILARVATQLAIVKLTRENEALRAEIARRKA